MNRDKLKIAFFAAYFLLAPLAGYYWNEGNWASFTEAQKYSSYIDGINRGKWVYVIDVHQPKVWADGEHDDAAALQKIIERSAGLNPTGVRPSITWFSEPKTHLVESSLILQPPSTIMGHTCRDRDTEQLLPSRTPHDLPFTRTDAAGGDGMGGYYLLGAGVPFRKSTEGVLGHL